jgi:hypothetical protein
LKKRRAEVDSRRRPLGQQRAIEITDADAEYFGDMHDRVQLPDQVFERQTCEKGNWVDEDGRLSSVGTGKPPSLPQFAEMAWSASRSIRLLSVRPVLRGLAKLSWLS